MIQIGIKGRQETIVTKELTAEAVGSGLLPVYATPMMIALMEKTAHTSLNEYLDEGQGTVGTLMNVSHLAATPLGMKVYCESELIEVDRRRLVFNVKAYDECGLIGEGTHERFIIDNQKFLNKANQKMQK